MKKIIFMAVFILFSTFVSAFANVEATGEGANKEQALTTAMRRAVEQGIGTFISGSTTVVDSALLDDKILSHSKGYVKSYKILKEGKTDDGYSVTISATVDSRELKDDIDALTILRKNVGNPRILVAYSKKGEGAKALKNKEFINEIYNGIVEVLTDKQFRVVDKASAEKFSMQVADTHEIDAELNKAAAAGLKYHAEYTLLYRVSGTIKEGAVNKNVQLRIKTELIDNTRSQVITSKMVEQSANGADLDQALEKGARAGAKKIVNPMIEVIQKNWMEMQQNGSIYTVVIDGVEDSEDISKFTAMFEKFPLVTDAKEIESGGGKTTFEAAYKGRRDLLDRDVLRAAKELGWKMKKVRAEGARSSWKRE